MFTVEEFSRKLLSVIPSYALTAAIFAVVGIILSVFSPVTGKALDQILVALRLL